MLQSHGASGVWELFIPGVGRRRRCTSSRSATAHTGAVLVKTDPYARDGELRPGTASRVAAAAGYAWRDGDWLARRAALGLAARADDHLRGARRLVAAPSRRAPLHLPRAGRARWCPTSPTWATRTSSCCRSPSIRSTSRGATRPPATSRRRSRYGAPDDLRAFVDACHAAGIGVILDWVPAHFPRDAWALARFDGTALYEHEDPRLGLHPDWGTHDLQLRPQRGEGFLLSSAHYWLAEFHFDGLRVDAVASMLYLDYSRKPGEWLPEPLRRAREPRGDRLPARAERHGARASFPAR